MFRNVFVNSKRRFRCFFHVSNFTFFCFSKIYKFEISKIAKTKIILQKPKSTSKKWFRTLSTSETTKNGNFLMHFGPRLKRKSTVAEQRGCALDKNMLACVKFREKKKHVQKCPERVKNYFIFFQCFACAACSTSPSIRN